jgi:hypothetical protein
MAGRLKSFEALWPYIRRGNMLELEQYKYELNKLENNMNEIEVSL